MAASLHSIAKNFECLVKEVYMAKVIIPAFAWLSLLIYISFEFPNQFFFQQSDLMISYSP